jgi:CheY-like chemotaxis protein
LKFLAVCSYELKAALLPDPMRNESKATRGGFCGIRLRIGINNCVICGQSSAINPRAMSIKGPIISIEDDADDQFLIKSVMEELEVTNELLFFSNGVEALLYLETTLDQPFLIICDINMPVMNGLELRERIDKNEYLRKKSIPFVFLSTADNPLVIETAYESTIQGFFKKENTFDELKARIRVMYDYWAYCLHPNHYN